MILPDGTTMMVDAGDNGPDNPGGDKLSAVPDDTRTPGEWIVRYVSRYLSEAGLPERLDYMLVTHFDNDHMGTPVASCPRSLSGRYYMTGVSYVGNKLEAGTLIDRGYPTYDFPFAGVFDKGSKGIMMNNYLQFIADEYSRVESIQAFRPGASDQITLLHDAASYPTFSVRNIYGNGLVWTGAGSTTKNIVPADASQSLLDNENQWSCVIHVNYGDFDYHCGGDIQAFGGWRNMESAVSKVIGETDVFLCDHHGNDDAMSEDIIRAAKPQVFVVPAWGTSHPGSDALTRMKDKSLYAGDRKIYVAGPVADVSPYDAAGHVVVRVYEGGATFQVFVLDDATEDRDIIARSAVLDANS